jgi:hypothetical protein
VNSEEEAISDEFEHFLAIPYQIIVVSLRSKSNPKLITSREKSLNRQEGKYRKRQQHLRNRSNIVDMVTQRHEKIKEEL